MGWIALIVYVLVGGLAARVAFVRHINKRGRNSIQDRDGYGEPVGTPHDPFAVPFWSGVFWPVVLVSIAVIWVWRHAIEAPTAREREERRQAEAHRRQLELLRKAAEIRQIAKQYDLPPLEGTISDGDFSIKLNVKEVS